MFPGCGYRRRAAGLGQAPLGVLTLAAILGQRGISVEVADLNRTYYRYLRSSAAAGVRHLGIQHDLQ